MLNNFFAQVDFIENPHFITFLTIYYKQYNIIKMGLNEELNRMRQLAGILNEAVQAPQAPQSVQAPQATTPKQQASQQTQQPIEIDKTKAQQTLDQGMAVLLQNLPSIVKKFTTTSGDKDGKLETGEEKTSQPNQQPAQKKAVPQQTTSQTQAKPIQENELKFDEKTYNEQMKSEDELNEAGLLGLVVSAPSIMQMGGKLLQKLGSKTNPNFIQKFGKTIADAGSSLHHKYIGFIEKAISPFMPNATPETKHKAAEAMFMVLVSGLFASSILHPEALTAVKGKEIADYIAQTLPGAMSTMGFG